MTANAIRIENTRAEHFAQIKALCAEVYPDSPAWTDAQLESHLRVFPEGQLVALDENDRVVGMASSLIVRWDDYDDADGWRDFTDRGLFTNHDPERGRTLYGAEIMVSPRVQGRGVGTKLYGARRELARSLGLLRIRAGARLAGYHRHADQMDAETYTEKVVKGELKDPTLTFQLGRGFQVIDVVTGYLRHDPKSLGFAAVIEWLNPEVATPADYQKRSPRFLRAG